MKHTASLDDREFLEKFNSNQIAPARFGHREHVRLAYTLLTLHEPQQAYLQFRESLLALLRYNSIDPAKYHETLTRAWMLAVLHFMEISQPQASAQSFIDANPTLLDPKIMLTHYSSDVIRSDRARQEFVEPDMEPIPRQEGRPTDGSMRLSAAAVSD